jgi:hypothetical protein
MAGTVSEPKIAREVAEAEVRRWAETVENPEGATEPLARAVMGGRLAFDEKAETFTVSLKYPVSMENGDTLKDLMIVQPTSALYRDCTKGNREGIDATLRLISGVSGRALGLVERVKKADLVVLMDCLNFFG